ncbi:hypothetical protein HBO00_21235 [Pseudomonas sp. WS 5407]|uniref:hypothetical protein n=1 Tax=Pseudomonas sp. WS 5407 TaxID=2717496 RepID=UPI00147558AA|nr:hypothetical protein [Pseudomonas sp. WS 5407]NMX46720.1 hypothetical protein [Pseudomonas sp. WS 5407]
MSTPTNTEYLFLPGLARSTARMQMRDMKSYLRRVERFFERDDFKLQSEEDKHYWETLDSPNNDGEDWLLKMRRLKHESDYNLFLKSSLGMLYSSLDIALFNIARLVSEITKIDLNPKNYDPKRTKAAFSGDIGTYAKYLIDFHNIDWDDLRVDWMRIDGFRITRNYVIHQGGELESEQLKRFDKIAMTEEGLGAFYLNEMSDLINVFFDKLCKKLDQRVIPNPLIKIKNKTKSQKFILCYADKGKH